MPGARRPRITLYFLTVMGCAPARPADPAPGGGPELVVPPLPPPSSPSSGAAEAAPPEAAPEEPRGLSYDEALAQLGVDGGAGRGRSLTNAELTGPLTASSFVAACGAPESMRVTVRVVVRRGRAVGVSVRTTPRDDAVVRCVDAHVRGLRWPSSPFVDAVTTTH